MRRFAVILVLSLSLLCLLPLHSVLIEVKAPNGHPVHNLNTSLNYTSIQGAMNANETLDGHTILVDAGIYYEHVVVNKSISLVGENKSNTVIDGYGGRWAVHVTANNVTFSEFTVRNGGKDQPIPWVPNGGIRLNSSGSKLSNNIVANNSYSGIWCGLSFTPTDNNVVENNLVKDNFYGIVLNSGSHNNLTKNFATNNICIGILIYGTANTLRQNLMSNNRDDFGANGIQDIDTSNLIDGKPIIYWIRERDRKVPSNAAHVTAINCVNITISDTHLKNLQIGVKFINTTSSKINGATILDCSSANICLLGSSGNTITNCTTISSEANDRLSLRDSNNNTIINNYVEGKGSGTGIEFYNCSYSTITGNTLVSNWYAISPTYSNSNRIYHNNFINNNNTVHVGAIKEENSWNNSYPSGGNYWSNYDGVDLFSGPYQNESGSDGIGDTPYIIDIDNEQMDYYPLMGMVHSFNTSLRKHVNVISNSTIDDFEYCQPCNFIRMHVSNMTADQTHGFCRIGIPYEVMSEPFNVTIDGASPTYWNYTLYDNGTHRWIYFSYQHSTLEVTIIPELPTLIILPLFMISTLLVAILYRRKRATHAKTLLKARA